MAIEISPYWARNRQKDAELVGGRMEEKRSWWEEGLRVAGANLGEVVEENSSAAEREEPIRICGCTCVRVCFPVVWIFFHFFWNVPLERVSLA